MLARSRLRHRLVHRAVRPVEERDHGGFGRGLPVLALDAQQRLAGGGQRVLAFPPPGRRGGGVEQRARAGRRRGASGRRCHATWRTAPTAGTGRTPARSGRRRAPRSAAGSRARHLPRRSGPPSASAGRAAAIPQPARSARRRADTRPAASGPPPGCGSGRRTPGRRSPRARSARSRSASPAPKAPRSGPLPGGWTAKSATVATSTLCETEESQVTGNRTGNCPNRSGSPSSRIRLIRGTWSRASSSTSSVSRHPQS